MMIMTHVNVKFFTIFISVEILPGGPRVESVGYEGCLLVLVCQYLIDLRYLDIITTDHSCELK